MTTRRELNVAYYNYGETDVTGYENTVNVDPSPNLATISTI